MSKPIGEIVLASEDSLYDDLLGVIVCSERPAGPARLIEPNAPDVPYNGTFYKISGTEDDAWPDAGDPYFEVDGTVSQRYYEWVRNPLEVVSLPLTISVVFYPLAGHIGRLFRFFESGDAGCYITFHLANTSIGTTIEVDDGTTNTKYTLGGSGQWPVNQWYSCTVTLADDGSGNVDITGVYKNKTEIGGSQDANNVVWADIAWNRIHLGQSDAGFGKGYFDLLAMWNTSLNSTLRDKVHDDFAAGVSPTWGLLEVVPNVCNGVLVGSKAVTNANVSWPPAFFRPPKLAYPIAPTFSAVSLVGRNMGRGMR